MQASQLHHCCQALLGVMQQEKAARSKNPSYQPANHAMCGLATMLLTGAPIECCEVGVAALSVQYGNFRIAWGRRTTWGWCARRVARWAWRLSAVLTPVVRMGQAHHSGLVCAAGVEVGVAAICNTDTSGSLGAGAPLGAGVRGGRRSGRGDGEHARRCGALAGG